ncbi:acyltransferase family protein [Pinibacter aurantiacus]|uniref:Acyltransferase n=1 Tax=Pinibacter aurantiacus TaxID=2851599 RepID=A0A9E2S681_9BACT|nr:acyltransferase [Pinibacter aurantiacus]MBV4356456.1 acyltransferase [Pinibacter aurantiacus]
MLSNQRLNRFKRITTSGAYYPEIDGIRFLCIVMVMLCHVTMYVQAYIAKGNVFELSPLLYAVVNGGLGVFPFFALSGYILSLPFLKAKFAKQSPPSLKKYFLRRLTRLEPPYIISLMLSFAVLVWALNKFTVNDLLPHFAASLFYVHHIFFPYTNPVVLPIAWTLEIEMMFYISLPFLLYVLYKLPTLYRRLIIFSVMIIVPLFDAGILSNYRFLPVNIPYFMAGIMVAEHVVTNENPFAFIPKKIKSLLLAGLLFLFFLSGYRALGFNSAQFNPIKLYVILALIVIDKTGYRFFANRYIATIGGMCYSLYLTHYAVISAIGRFIHYPFFGGHFTLNLLVYSFIFLVPALVVGAIFYLLIEQPAMRKNWWKKTGNKAVTTGVK